MAPKGMLLAPWPPTQRCMNWMQPPMARERLFSNSVTGVGDLRPRLAVPQHKGIGVEVVARVIKHILLLRGLTTSSRWIILG